MLAPPPQVLHGPLHPANADQGEIVLHQLIQAGQLRLDLGQRLGHLGRTVGRGLLEFLGEHIDIQKDRPQGIADFMREARRQPAQHGKVGRALGVLFQPLPFEDFLLGGPRSAPARAVRGDRGPAATPGWPPAAA